MLTGKATRSDNRNWQALRADFTFLSAVFFSVLMILVGASDAEAFRVSPLVLTLEPEGVRSAETFQVENTLARPLAVEITIFERAYGERGEELRRPADTDFAVFPPQMVIESGELQAVRLQYVGNKKIKVAKNYVVLVTQLPVELEASEEAGVQFMFEFGASVTVSPRNAAPAIQVTEFRAVSKSLIEIKIRNDGDGLARLGEMRWTFRGDGGRFVLDRALVREQVTPGLLLPGGVRVLSLTLPSGRLASDVRAITVSRS